MAYLPKSKYSVKTTHGNELVYKRDKNKVYVGDYMLTSNGKYYAGVNNTRLGPELILQEFETADQIELLEIIDPDVAKHKIFKDGIDKFISGTKPIPLDTPFPTEEDYEKGFFTRFFVKRINGEIYIEISEKTYKDIKSKKPTYDYNLYEIGQIRWHITGNVFKKNTITIKQTQKKFKTIDTYFLRLDEYKLDEPLYQSNLYTDGGELYLANGKDYVGDYHIHETGPMVGPVHTETPHEKLYYVNKLPSLPDTTYEDFLASTLPKGNTTNIKPPKKPFKTLVDKFNKNIKPQMVREERAPSRSTSSGRSNSSSSPRSTRGRSGY